MSTLVNFTREQLLATPAGTLAQEPAELLFAIKSAATESFENAKALCEHLEQVTDYKWSERARNLRHDAGKDTGVIHFDDGNVRITADLPKKVEWDQARLAQISKRIADSGENATQYVEVTYRVSETKFNAWPQTIKSAFEAARTVKTGKASYRLALMKE